MLNLTSQHNITDNFCCGDKSVSHRALMLAAIADGKCVLRNVSVCRDVLSTADCLRTLGAQIEFSGTTATVIPVAEPKNGVVLNCRNSGTTARLLAGLVAGLGVEAVFLGDKSLSKRPMQRILQPLSQMGAKFCYGNGFLFKNLPAQLHGEKLIARQNSAQVKSGVLLAGLFAEGSTEYTEQLPTRNHTEILLKKLGADIEITNLTVRVGKSRIPSFEMQIPNDISSAAFLIALALLDGTERVFRNVCINPRRSGFLRVLQNSGADITAENVRDVFGETVADIRVKKSELLPLFAAESDVCDAIDEIPVLAALAVATRGTHTFCGVSELRYKECDRIEAILQTAEACGQKCTFDGENLTVISDGNVAEKPCFNCFSDHRMAMSQAVLALGVCGGASILSSSEMARASFFTATDVGGSCNSDCPDAEVDFSVSFPDFSEAAGVKPLRFGLVGQCVCDSMSPLLMSYLARSANVCCSYTPAQLPADVSDGQLLQALRQFDGVNVTMPFKTRAAKLLGSVVPSINTAGRNLQPTSTDGYGIVQSLKAHGIDFENKPLWIVGAGGAAESCVIQLKPYGCKMQILNRTAAHSENLTQKYRLSEKIENPEGVLSFVPVCEFEKQIGLPHSVRFVFTASYKGQSALAVKAVSRGIAHVCGLEMLFHQGAKSFSLWTGTDIQTDYAGFLNYAKIFCKQTEPNKVKI